jgi:hypothetical protein
MGLDHASRNLHAVADIHDATRRRRNSPQQAEFRPIASAT